MIAIYKEASDKEASDLPLFVLFGTKFAENLISNNSSNKFSF